MLIEIVEKPVHIVMATSIGDEQDYVHMGQIRFSVQGQMAILQVCLPNRWELLYPAGGRDRTSRNL